MPTLNDLVRRHACLEDADLDWLHLLVADWQLLADLSFADLVLWVPRCDGHGYVAIAHCRPSTGATVYYEDQVGRMLERGLRPQVDAAYDEARICRERDPEWLDAVPVREETVPVVRGGPLVRGGPRLGGGARVGGAKVLAVLARHTNLASARTPSRLELTYLQCADALVGMVASGHFPTPGTPSGMGQGAPRVGDGLLTLDAEGNVRYASPNALAGFHRLGLVGDLVGRSLPEVTSALVDDSSPVDESMALVVTGRAPWRTEVASRSAALSLRAVPLVVDGVRSGAVLLCRDVSELRRHEMQLMTKDATIREIHHRVKNNLQTVAALLRLQARRMTSPEARQALEEAMRRVGTIALVHQTLSQGLDEQVNFDQLLDGGLLLAADLAGESSGATRALRRGEIGTVAAQDATPLALVLNELVSNAFEHGASEGGGTVVVSGERDGDRLRITVEDDGGGLPVNFRPGAQGLGTQIVSALVTGELRGTIRWRTRPEGGTTVELDVRLRGQG
ncbi:MAG: sensor histidine kinase [Actinomycetes bacterium]